MAGEFEKMMNEKMDNASVHDVLPGFDKEATWDELSAMLPEKKKRVLPLWWTHAAAVVAGLLIGGMLWHFAIDKEDTQVIVAKNPETTSAVTDVIIKRDTVFIRVQPQEVVAKTTNKKTAAPSQQIKRPNLKNNQPQPREEVIVTTTPEQPQTTQPAIQPEVKYAAKKAKPVHLLDIQNENRETALFHNDPEAARRSQFVLQITTDRLPDNNNQQEPSLLRELLKK